MASSEGQSSLVDSAAQAAQTAANAVAQAAQSAGETVAPIAQQGYQTVMKMGRPQFKRAMTYSKKAIHFGGGNIGRGFVAEFLHNSGYEVIFVDVVDEIIQQFNRRNSYSVVEMGNDGDEVVEIDHFRAINSKTQEDEVVDEISKANLVTCAVGPNVLRFIAPVIAKGIDKRGDEYQKELHVIACENMIGATDTLKSYIIPKLVDTTEAELPNKARFANSAVDRIVPQQDPGAGLDVKLEKFYEWCVDQTPFKDSRAGIPPIQGVHFVDHLEPYIERKLFTVNTGHATAAYYGHNRGKRTIHDAMTDPEIRKIVEDVLKETAQLIIDKHEISAEEQYAYVDKILVRISNPHLEDVVERVGRAPLRKLGRKERFIGPASQLAEKGEKHSALLGAIEVTLQFQNVEGDEESRELAKILKEQDAAEATKTITGLETSHPLFKEVEELVRKVQSGGKGSSQ